MTYPIPPEALKESVAIIGRTGSGKTFAAKGAVELLLREGARVCIIDPTSVWWGLRSSANGKNPGLPVVVFGGDHGDVATNEHSGAALATLIAGQNLPAIVDVAEFTMGGRVRFMTAFLENLYRLNKTPLTLVIDEADLFAPQRAMPDQTVMLSRMEQIVRRGRVRGFRPWLITQRPAELHKSVLSQANTLVAMQLTAPQDRDAVGAWIEGQADRVKGKEILADLARLKKGEGWVWSPTHEVLARVRFPAITTYDSGRSPEEGETAGPAKLAEVDLSAIGESLRVAEAEIADNDPKVLRARITELERAAVKPDRAALDEAFERGRAAGVADAGRAWGERVDILLNGMQGLAERLSEATRPLRSTAQAVENPKVAGISVTSAELRKAAQRIESTVNGAIAQAVSGLPKAEHAILTAIAQRDPKPTSRAQASILSGYSIKSSSFANACGALRSQGLIDGRGDDMRITPDGKKAVGKVPPMPGGPDLVAYWANRLPKAEAVILQTIVDRYPREADKEYIATRSGYSLTSSSFANALGKLRSLQLVHGRAELKASPDFFS